MSKETQAFLDSLFIRTEMERWMENGEFCFRPPHQSHRVTLTENTDGTMNISLISPKTGHTATNQGIMNLTPQMAGRLLERMIQ